MRNIDLNQTASIFVMKNFTEAVNTTDRLQFAKLLFPTIMKKRFTLTMEESTMLFDAILNMPSPFGIVHIAFSEWAIYIFGNNERYIHYVN